MSWTRLLLTAMLMAQDPSTLKLDVQVVSVDVTVVDSKGNLVNRLGKDDFLITENGIPQSIRFFSPVSTPYNIFLLFDSSGSTRGDRQFMVSAALALLDNLRPEDRVAFGSFDDGFRKHLSWTADRNLAAAALREVTQPHESNETHFYSALDETLRKEFKGVIGRRAIVVLTDGQDTQMIYGSNGDLKKVLQSAREQRIPIFLVALLGQPASQGVFPNTQAYLETVRFNMQHIVDNSGGEILFSKDLDDVVRFYEQLGRRLGMAYSLGYVPSNSSNDGSFRRIQIKIRDDSLHLSQSREGYYARPR
jgi:Ca-activated chloride channel homolog